MRFKATGPRTTMNSEGIRQITRGNASFTEAWRAIRSARWRRRILSSWESQGLVVGGRERISIREPAKLREIAERAPE